MSESGFPADSPPPETPESPASSAPRRRGPVETVRRLKHVGPLAFLTLLLPVLSGLGVVVALVPLGRWFADLGGAGPWVFVGLAVVLGGLSVLPTHGLSLLSGYAFGFSRGLGLAITSIVLAAALGFYLKSLLTRRLVMDLISENPRAQAVHQALVGGAFWRTSLMVMLIRLSPVAPFAVTNLAMASTAVRWPAFLLGTAAGMLPRCLAVVGVGAMVALLGEEAERKPPLWLVGLGIAATVAALVLIGTLSRRALLRVAAENPNAPAPQAD